eukprot:Pgem_evm1s3569
MFSIFVDHSEEIKTVITEYMSKGKVFDLQQLLYCFTLDSICDIAMGVKLRSIESFRKK